MARIPILRTSPKVWQLLGPSLYSEYPLLAVTLRELFQNARDACLASGEKPSITIELKADSSFSQGVLSCNDNGIGMDEDVILDRFLVLGESKKSAGSTGGFGIAKATILGACNWWEVHTRNLYISYDHVEEGRPIDYVPARVGTRVTLHYEPPGQDRQSRAIRLDPYKFAKGLSWIAHSDTPCHIKVELDGLEPQEWHLPGLDLTELEPIYRGEDGQTRWVVYQLDPLELAPLRWKYNDIEPISKGYVFYRANGLVQFTEYLTSDHPNCFVVEINTDVEPGSPAYPFTPSREDLVGEIKKKIKDCLTAHEKNPLTSANRYRNRNKPKDQVIYEGGWLGGTSAGDDKNQLRLAREVTGGQAALRHASIMEAAGNTHRGKKSPLGVKLCMKGLSHTRRNLLAPHNLRLLDMWGQVLELVAEASGSEEKFGIGFVFDDDSRAERYVCDEGVFYLLNPTGLAVSRPAETLLIMLVEASHEMAHREHRHHDEAFSSCQAALLRKAAPLFVARRRELERKLAGRKPHEERGGAQLALF